MYQAEELRFGRFQVRRRERRLLVDGAPVELGFRALDVLLALIDAGGALVSKDALLSRVWPGAIVEEHNLTVQIHALRKAFGPDRDLIRTVSRHGYCFTGEVQANDTPLPPGGTEPDRAPDRLPVSNISLAVQALIGREDELQELFQLQANCRLLTLTGAGGIGKTALALELARRLRVSFRAETWLVELAPLSNPALVPSAVAGVLGLRLEGAEMSAEAVARAIGSKTVRFVLDNCEHLIDAAATVADVLVRRCPNVSLLVTSREALRIESEHVYRVPALGVPPEQQQEPEQLLRHGAVKFFVAKLRDLDPHVAASAENLPMIAAICRRLDGIPLALELAAARAAILGVREVAARLDDRFGLLTAGRRTAMPRHQTLRATLDWSHELLAEPERILLRRLAVFPAGFTVNGAIAVAQDAERGTAAVLDGVTNLVAKSLLAFDGSAPGDRWRLLETVRAYALEKLAEAGERDAVERRQAEFLLQLLQASSAVLESQWSSDDVRRCAREIDNVRATLDWAFGAGGDSAIGGELTVACVPLWMHLSLLDECRARVVQSLAALEGRPDNSARRDMKLYAALGASLIYTRGAVPEVGSAWTKALDAARLVGDVEYQLLSFWGLWTFHINGGQHRAALELAERHRGLATNSPNPKDWLHGEQMIAISQHYMGDQAGARRHIESVLTAYSRTNERHFIRYSVDPRVTARGFLARILWLQGYPDQAMRAAEASVDDALTGHHASSLNYSLAFGACPVALLVGDLARAERYVEMLLDHSGRHSMGSWHAIGRSRQGVLFMQRGDVTAGLKLLRAGLEEAGERRFTTMRIFTVHLAEAMGRAGQVAEGLELIANAIEYSDRSEERWLVAELLRVNGELLLMQANPGGAAAAEGCFQQALDWARRQLALSWELRAAASLARLWRGQGRSTEARALLQPIRERFSEGSATADVAGAERLLGELAA